MTKIDCRVLDLADQLHSAAIHLLRQLRTGDRASGIGPAQLSALSVLVFGGAMSLRQLAAAEQVKPPTMVRIVQSLVEQRLAKTQPDTQDGRRISITATPRGRLLMQRARKRRVAALAALIAQLPSHERGKLQTAVVVMRTLRVSKA